MLIVGETLSANRIKVFKKEVDGEAFVFTDQPDAVECAESMTKRLGGEWTVFEVTPITTSKMVTTVHRPVGTSCGHCGAEPGQRCDADCRYDYDHK